MKMVKNIAIVALSTTFMFAGIGFHMATNYSTLQADDVTVGNSYGVTYGLSSTASVGYDSKLGMIMFFAAPAGSLRVAANARILFSSAWCGAARKKAFEHGGRGAQVKIVPEGRALLVVGQVVCARKEFISGDATMCMR